METRQDDGTVRTSPWAPYTYDKFAALLQAAPDAIETEFDLWQRRVDEARDGRHVQHTAHTGTWIVRTHISAVLGARKDTAHIPDSTHIVAAGTAKQAREVVLLEMERHYGPSARMLGTSTAIGPLVLDGDRA